MVDHDDGDRRAVKPAKNPTKKATTATANRA